MRKKAIYKPFNVIVEIVHSYGGGCGDSLHYIYSKHHHIGCNEISLDEFENFIASKDELKFLDE